MRGVAIGRAPPDPARVCRPGHDHAFERQKPIHPRRRQAGLGRDFARHLDGAGKRRGIDLQPARAFRCLHGQGDLQRAPQEAFARQHAGRALPARQSPAECASGCPGCGH